MRAILLAAGMGTRLRPYTENTPKSLVVVNGKPLLERQVEFLKEKGIDEIIIITGYLKDKFDYLVDKYGVTIIYNEKYNEYNNIYSMYLAKDYLEDTYVIDADVYISRNFFKEAINKSTYFSAFKENVENEWKLVFDNEDNIMDIEIMDGIDSGYILSGVSYWSKLDGKKIVEQIEEAIARNSFKSLYWDNIVKDNVKALDIKIEKLMENDIYEIDSVEDLNRVKAIVSE